MGNAIRQARMLLRTYALDIAAFILIGLLSALLIYLSARHG